MGHTAHGYTWQDVLLNIDIRDEAEKERKEQEAIMREQAEEGSWASGLSLGLSILGGAVFGPAGYMAGKMIGRHAADYMYDWEDMDVSAGKFHQEEAREFEKARDKAASDQTSGQILNAFTDIATMYVQSGGLTAEPGAWDPTTFGSGEDAWTVFGDESIVGEGFDIPFTNWNISGSTLPAEQAVFAGSGTKIWQEGGLQQLQMNLKKGDFKGAWAADQSIGTLSDLGRLAVSYYGHDDEEEKGSGRMLSSVGRFTR